MIAREMRKGTIFATSAAAGLMTVSLFGQGVDGAKGLMAEDVFKNVQVLKGISVNAAIDDRCVDVAEGIAPSGLRVKLFFDQDTGLLVRATQFTNTAVGIVPTQVDYSDYREVAGVKMPFKWITTWTEGQSTTELTEIRAKVAIDAAKFARPNAPAAPRSRTAEK